MRLQRFLDEARTQPMKYDAALKGMLSKYSDILEYYNTSSNWFLRGLKSATVDFALIKPSKSERKSAYTDNYYTLITSGDPSWANIPARSKSVVGSTGFDKASGYKRKGGLYVVLPKNGSNIAQAQSEDFWGTFQHVFGDEDYPLGRFNDDLSTIFKYIFRKLDDYSIVPDESLSKLKQACKIVDDYVKNNYDGDTHKFLYNGDLYFSYMEVFDDYYKGDFYEMLVKIFNPKAGNIKVVKAGQSLRDDVEVWTDGDCLLIEFDVFKKNLPELLSIMRGEEQKFVNTQLADELGKIKLYTNWRGITFVKKKGENDY